jgi:hypothetical protein
MSKARGSPKAGGRRPGSLNRSTAEIKTLAQEHGAQAIRVLRKLMNSKSSTERTRLAAVKAILNHGYGKCTKMDVSDAM